VDHLSRAELAKMDSERAEVRRASADLRRASMLAADTNCFEMEDTNVNMPPGKPSYLAPVDGKPPAHGQTFTHSQSTIIHPSGL